MQGALLDVLWSRIKSHCMKMKSFLLTLLISCSLMYNTFGQSIPSHWMSYYELDHLYEHRSEGVQKIIADKKGYYASGQSYKERWVYNFKEPNVIQGEFYKGTELNTRFIYELDSLNRRAKNIIETKIPLVGWQKSAYVFEYVGDYRASERHLDADNNLLRIAKYEYDALGRPIKLQIFNPHGELDSYETAEYHDNGSYTYRVFSAKGDLALQKTNFANVDTSSNKLNENGDLVEFAWPTASPDSRTHYTLRYKYDSNKNWTERDVQVESRNKQSKQSSVRRKITYKKN